MPLHAAAKNALTESIASIAVGILDGNGIVVQLNLLGVAYSMLYFALRRTIWTFLYTHSFGLAK